MSDESKKQLNKSTEDDEELSELLDSALKDFDSKKKDKQPEEKEEQKTEEKSTLEDADVWSEEFIKKAAAEFESNLSQFLGTSAEGGEPDQEQLQRKFQQMAEAAQQALSNPGEVTQQSSDYASTISQTIQGLTQGAENLQNPLSEQDIMNMFGGGGDQNAFLPFMQGMMQSLLSKEVLYPSLKDILDRFPEWMENNKEKIAAEDKDRYEKQQKLMEEVCGVLEQEKDTDSVETKKERFEKVLELMQRLQDYGQPPADLVGDVGPPLPLDMAGGMPDPSQCVLM